MNADQGWGIYAHGEGVGCPLDPASHGEAGGGMRQDRLIYWLFGSVLGWLSSVVIRRGS